MKRAAADVVRMTVLRISAAVRQIEAFEPKAVPPGSILCSVGKFALALGENTSGDISTSSDDAK